MMSILLAFFLIPPFMLMIPNAWVLSQITILLVYLYMLLSMNIYGFFSHISYCLGVDMVSFMLILLSLVVSSFMLISMVLDSSFGLFNYINSFLLLMLIIIFSSMNIIYMYICFEFVLIPLLILIMGWGLQPERLLAGMYLFFYTLFFSLPLLMLIVYIYLSSGSLFFDGVSSLSSSFFLVHLILTLVFLVKLPMYMVHFWLPKAHVQAPVSGSMLLAGVMLKIGGYGLIRTLFMFENLSVNYSFIWFSFSMVGSLLISVVCLVQIDMKCLIAYSSISHMGMVIMGLMTMTKWGLMGSYLLMLGHGLCSSGLFYMANMVYLSTSSRSFFINKGLMAFMPSSCLFWFLLCCFNMSCPPSLNFISELMILLSSMNYWFFSIYYFIFISFFCACFSYYLYSFSQHGLFHSLYSFSSSYLINYLCLFMHLYPLIFILLVIPSF